MSNLSVENLNRIVQTGDAEQLLGGGIQPTSGQEAAALKEMQFQGMEVPASSTTGDSKTFLDIFKNSVEKVNQDQVQSDAAIKELIAGKAKNIHETMLTIERADTSMKLMMAVRNKILDAYKEIMRMQV